MVVLDKAFYLSMGEQMLSDTTVYEPLTKNPLKDEQAYFNRKMEDVFISMGLTKTAWRFKTRVPSLPYFYILPKIHKTPLSFRPIVSQSQSFTKGLSQHLANILSPLLGTFSDAH